MAIMVRPNIYLNSAPRRLTPWSLSSSFGQVILLIAICCGSGGEAALPQAILPAKSHNKLHRINPEELSDKVKKMNANEAMEYVLEQLPEKPRDMLKKYITRAQLKLHRVQKTKKKLADIRERLQADDETAAVLRNRDNSAPASSRRLMSMQEMNQQGAGVHGTRDTVTEKWWMEWMRRRNRQRYGHKEYIVPSKITLGICEQFEWSILPRLLDVDYPEGCDLERAGELEGILLAEVVLYPYLIYTNTPAWLARAIADAAVTKPLDVAGGETLEGVLNDFCSYEGPQDGTYCGSAGFYANVTREAIKYAGSIAEDCNWTLVSNTSGIGTPSELLDDILADTQDLCMNHTSDWCYQGYWVGIYQILTLFDADTSDEQLGILESFIPQYCSECSKLLTTTRRSRRAPKRAKFATIESEDCTTEEGQTSEPETNTNQQCAFDYQECWDKPCCGDGFTCYSTSGGWDQRCYLTGTCTWGCTEIDHSDTSLHDGCSNAYYASNYCPDEGDLCYKAHKHWTELEPKACLRRDNRCFKKNWKRAFCKPLSFAESCNSNAWDCGILQESEAIRIEKEQTYNYEGEGDTEVCVKTTRRVTVAPDEEDFEYQDAEDSLNFLCSRLAGKWCYLDVVQLEAEPDNITKAEQLWCGSGCLKAMEKLSIKRDIAAAPDDGSDNSSDVRLAYANTFCKRTNDRSQSCFEVMQVYNKTRSPAWDQLIEHCNAPELGGGTYPFPDDWNSISCSAACSTAWNNWLDEWGCCARTWSSAQDVLLHRWMLYQGQECGRFLPDGCVGEELENVTACFWLSNSLYMEYQQNEFNYNSEFCGELEYQGNFDFDTCTVTSANPYLIGYVWSSTGQLTGDFLETLRICVVLTAETRRQQASLVDDMLSYAGSRSGVQLLSNEKGEKIPGLLQVNSRSLLQTELEDPGGDPLLLVGLSAEPAQLRADEDELVTATLETLQIGPLPTPNRTAPKNMPLWGDYRFANISACNEARTWKDLKPFFRNHTARTGGLGTIEERGIIEAWICVQSHLCVLQQPQFSMLPKEQARDDFMCFVYDELRRQWIPWGFNSNLRLVKNPPTMAETMAKAQNATNSSR